MLETFITDEVVLARLDRLAATTRSPLVRTALQLAAARNRGCGAAVLIHLRELLTGLALRPDQLDRLPSNELVRVTDLLLTDRVPDLPLGEIFPPGTLSRLLEVAAIHGALHTAPHVAGAAAIALQVAAADSPAEQARLLQLVELLGC